jgi:hypothetical protein
MATLPRYEQECLPLTTWDNRLHFPSEGKRAALDRV